MLHSQKTIHALLAIAALALSAHAATPEQIKAFAPYQAIIDRQPFGKVPSPSEMPVVQTQEEQMMAQQEQMLANQVGMCAVNNTSDGVMVGFYDCSENPPKNYYLAVGESAGEFTLVNASFEDKCATVEKNGVTIDLKLGEGPKQAAPGGAKGSGSSKGPRIGGSGVKGAGEARAPDTGHPNSGRTPQDQGEGSVDAVNPGTPVNRPMSFSERRRMRERQKLERDQQLRDEAKREGREEAEQAAAESAAAVIADAEERMQQKIDEALNNQQDYGDSAQADDNVQYVEEGYGDPQ